MFTLKPILTTAIVLGSVLTQQATMAYLKASQTLEINYLLASVQNIYGDVSPEIMANLKAMYSRQDPNTELMLSGGYQICDGIKLANARGIDSQALIEQEISNISQMTNTILGQQGMSITQRQIVTAYNTAKNYLCPELN